MAEAYRDVKGVRKEGMRNFIRRVGGEGRVEESVDERVRWRAGPRSYPELRICREEFRGGFLLD